MNFLKGNVMNSLGPVLPILESASPPAIDPVCGMTVDPAHAAGSHVHHATTFYLLDVVPAAVQCGPGSLSDAAGRKLVLCPQVAGGDDGT